MRNLGKNIPSKLLRDATIAQIAGLKKDVIIRTQDGGASHSFTHDIFFEWVFFRHLIELGNEWIKGLIEAGEPPLLGRVVSLLAQSALLTPGKWSAGYQQLSGRAMRPQWRREWLTSAPFTPAFEQGKQEFQTLLMQNDYALFEKVLVWFQAQHTIPSPAILQNLVATVEGVDRVAAAELLSWPSDFQSWGRFLDWLIPLAPGLPPRLLPHVLEVFGVWQNVFADICNPRSAAFIAICGCWLIDFEQVEYPETFKYKRGRWDALGSEARSGLATALRVTIMRSARSYPAPAIALFDRAVANGRMRRAAYSDLMGFTSTMADVSPGAVVAVTKAELMEELPQDKLDREEQEHKAYMESLKLLRAIPEAKRTQAQKNALNNVSLPGIGRGTQDHGRDDIGIDQHHNYYYPPSALQEPFATLFVKKPVAALDLVRDLVNHATKGWRQIQLLDRRHRGTPIPVIVEFPWGTQTFWGNWNVYCWFFGSYLAPQPLECAFLAVSHWAFKQIEAGKRADEVIRAIVNENDCYAILGLASMIALESHEVSEVTFPIVTCQRLWEHDIARCVQEPAQNADLFGLSDPARLTGKKAEAKGFLDSRKSRKHDIRQLAMEFAICPDEALRERFKKALASFPENLPFEIEEHRSNECAKAHFKENANRWAGLGDIKNYRKHEIGPEKIAIAYQAPNPPTRAEEQRLSENTIALQELAVIAWATRSLQASKIQAEIKLENAIPFAKERDTATILEQRHDVDGHSPQTTISATAALVICFGPTGGVDNDWAWDVMDRVFEMKEPDDAFHGSIISWHPGNHLVAALSHDRRCGSPRRNSAQRLIKLTFHPNEGVAQLAFRALFRDADEHIQWVAAQLVMDLAIYHEGVIKLGGERDDGPNQKARAESLARALERLKDLQATPFAEVPAAWVKATDPRQANRIGMWHNANPSFNPQYAATLFPYFPVEMWCQSSANKPMFERTLTQLVTWTAERLMPSWRNEEGHHEREHSKTEMISWNRVLGGLLARAAPFYDIEFVRKSFLAPFVTDDEEGLAVLAAFTDVTITRQVLDAPTIPTNTFALLSDCVDRVISDRVFSPGNYRAGQLHGFDLPNLIEALLFVQ